MHISNDTNLNSNNEGIFIPSRNGSIVSSIGIETVGGLMHNIFRRKTELPAQHYEVFANYLDDQSTMTVKVFSGENAMAYDNIFVAKYEIVGFPPIQRGIPHVEIIFDLTSDGKLLLTRKNQDQNERINPLLCGIGSHQSDGERSDASMAEALRVTAKIELESTIYRIRNILREQITNDHEKKSIRSPKEEVIVPEHVFHTIGCNRGVAESLIIAEAASHQDEANSIEAVENLTCPLKNPIAEVLVQVSIWLDYYGEDAPMEQILTMQRKLEKVAAELLTAEDRGELASVKHQDPPGVDEGIAQTLLRLKNAER